MWWRARSADGPRAAVAREFDDKAAVGGGDLCVAALLDRHRRRPGGPIRRAPDKQRRGKRRHRDSRYRTGPHDRPLVGRTDWRPTYLPDAAGKGTCAGRQRGARAMLGGTSIPPSATARRSAGRHSQGRIGTCARPAPAEGSAARTGSSPCGDRTPRDGEERGKVADVACDLRDDRVGGGQHGQLLLPAKGYGHDETIWLGFDPAFLAA